MEEREFIEILLSRKSVRTWSDDGINIGKLSKLFLRYSFGMRSNDFENIGFRTYAGARYPITRDICFNLNSDDIEKGIYHYNVYNNSLDL